MPKVQRTQEEIDQVKFRILKQAARLIVDIGYDGFTMRKLGVNLGVTATTIYNYYKNKDDLFINLLIKGFDSLYQQLEAARAQHHDPSEQLRAMIAAYMEFGLTNVNFYNLMYTWHVPKYNTYAGTSMEPVAKQQLEVAMKIPGIFSATIMDYAGTMDKQIKDQDVRFLLIHYWSIIHGFIAGCNNTNLSYIHEDPLSLKEKHLTGIAEKFRQDISQLPSQGE